MRTLRALAIVTTGLMCTACGGGGGAGSPPPSTPPPPPSTPQLPDAAAAPALKTIFAPDFRVGAAVAIGHVDPTTRASDVALIQKHFSTLTPENAMKADTIGVAADQYDFGPADQIVAFAQANGIAVRGHALVWHQITPDWFFAGDTRDPASYHADVKRRLETYVRDVVTHFKGKVYAWDVVNEVAGDEPGQIYRTNSNWYQAYSIGGNGADYIEDAFRAARAADPDVKLFINDYATDNPAKRANLLAIVRDLMDKGVPLDGVGHQFHLTMAVPATNVDAALTAVEQLNPALINQVTELDLSIYTDSTSDYGPAAPPLSALSQQAQKYRDLFAVFRKHETSIDSVTMWGVSDAETWLDHWPTTRKDRPLLFDTNRQPKWAFWAVVDPALRLP